MNLKKVNLQLNFIKNLPSYTNNRTIWAFFYWVYFLEQRFSYLEAKI
jgi:hypothetical protein